MTWEETALRLNLSLQGARKRAAKGMAKVKDLLRRREIRHRD